MLRTFMYKKSYLMLLILNIPLELLQLLLPVDDDVEGGGGGVTTFNQMDFNGLTDWLTSI